MGHTQRSVGNTTANNNNFHIDIVVADIVPDLLQAPEGGEVGNGVGNGNVPAPPMPLAPPVITATLF